MTKNYPAASGPYKTKILNKCDWQSRQTARFDISIGQLYHEGDKFFAAIEWASHRFDKVIISVGDTIQRYNEMFERSIGEDEARTLTLKQGQEWLDRVAPTLAILPNVEIEHWEQWRTHPEQFDYEIKARNLYATNKEFREEVDALTEARWQKHYADHPVHGGKHSLMHAFSTDYLLEETAAIAIMAKERKGEIHIYPGTFMGIIDTFIKHQPNPDQYDLAFAKIDFVRNKGYNPQNTTPQAKLRA